MFDALTEAPPATDAGAAFQLVVDCLNRVEDLHSGVAAEPLPPKSVDTGRMYPPQSDSIQRLEDGSVIAHSRAHIVGCGPNGSISIETRRGTVLFLSGEYVMTTTSEPMAALNDLAAELRSRMPRAKVECTPMEEGGVWLVATGDDEVLSIQWSPRLAAFGVSLDTHDDTEAAFAPHEQYFTTFVEARAYVYGLLARPNTLVVSTGKHRSA